MAGKRRWTFLSSHGSLLVEVARDPDAIVRDLAERVGLTDRQTHRVLADLRNEGYLVGERVGSRIHYRIDTNRPLRHSTQAHRKVGELLAVLAAD
jgi:DNA-binding IclR family transcriptional regulator